MISCRRSRGEPVGVAWRVRRRRADDASFQGFIAMRLRVAPNQQQRLTRDDPQTRARSRRKSTGKKLEAIKRESVGLSSRTKGQKKKEERLEYVLKQSTTELQKVKLFSTVGVSAHRAAHQLEIPRALCVPPHPTEGNVSHAYMRYSSID